MRRPCPRCQRMTVDVHVSSWPTAGSRTGWRRSVWVDEPLRCQRGCRLSSPEVARVLLATYRQVTWQLPLDLQAEAA